MFRRLREWHAKRKERAECKVFVRGAEFADHHMIQYGYENGRAFLNQFIELARDFDELTVFEEGIQAVIDEYERNQ